MEKNVYPQVPQLPGAPDAPPSYNQSSGPMVPMAPMAPMPMGQPQPFGQPQTVYIQSQTIPPLGPRPCMVTCPSCGKQQMTTMIYETGTKTHLFAALLCILGLFCCACIPYCVDNCKNPNHYCSNCNAYLGMYK